MTLILSLIERLFPSSNAVTEGPSPKVTIPAVVLAGIGAVLIVAGLLTKADELVGYGVAILAASGVGAAAGTAAGPGSVVVGAPVVGGGSDDTLPDDVTRELAAIPTEATPPERRA